MTPLIIPDRFKRRDPNFEFRLMIKNLEGKNIGVQGTGHVESQFVVVPETTIINGVEVPTGVQLFRMEARFDPSCSKLQMGEVELQPEQIEDPPQNGKQVKENLE